MMMNMTEADYENWRDDLRCGGQEEYDTQYSEAVAQKQKNIDGRDEQIANLNSIIKMQADRIKELEEGVESSASRVMALENENVHLKARLYDILMK